MEFIHIKGKAIDSMKWTIGSNFLTSFVSLFFGIIIARLLTPRDFGIIAIANTFVAFGTVFSKMGLAGSIIQKKEIKKIEVSACFTVSLLIGLLIYSIIFININFINNFFNVPNLDKIILLLSLTFILQSIVVTSTSLLERSLDYPFLTKVEFLTQIFGKALVTIIFAYFGFGVWSIVIGILTAQLLSTIILFLKNSTYFSLTFSKNSYKDIYSYSIKFSIIQFIDYLYGNSNTFFIGKAFGANITGLYDRSAMLARLPVSNLIVAVNRVMFPVYSRLQGDHQNTSRIFFINLFLLGTICSIVAGGMASLSKEIILLLLGSKWVSAIVPLKYLCIFSCYEYLASLMFSPLDSHNKIRQRIFLKMIPFVFRIIFYLLVFFLNLSFTIFLLYICVIEVIYFIIYTKAAMNLFAVSVQKFIILITIQTFNIFSIMLLINFSKELLLKIGLNDWLIFPLVVIYICCFFLLNLYFGISLKFYTLDLIKSLVSKLGIKL